MKGIVLLAHSRRVYGFAAYNLALSIKRFNPDLKIALLHDDIAISEIDTSLFDVLVKVEGGDPGKVKLSLYNYLPFEYNLYLDVDSIALKDIEPILNYCIEKGGFYYTHVAGIYSGGEFKELMWAEPEEIFKRYKLNTLPSINSSIQFIKKCKGAKDLFSQALKNFSNPIPLKMKWGKTEPDELYMNIALGQKDIDPRMDSQVFFANEIVEFSELVDKYSILTLWGGKGFTKIRYMEWYDRLMHKYAREMNRSHIYKINLIMPGKHVNQ